MGRKKLGEGAALAVAALLALNPAFVVTSSCWGQIDSVLALLLVLMLLYARAGRWAIAIPIFALAVLAKPQAGLLAPLGVAALMKRRVWASAAEKPSAWVCWAAWRRRLSSCCPLRGAKTSSHGWWINTRRRFPAIRTRRSQRAT
ncbi:MAG: hypothetical protein ACLUHE_11070 [Christensenellales bacterium]